MRPFASLDPVSLRAFYFAAQSLHFTRAAKAAGLTQSGVSQHIQKLEQELAAPLFHREQRKIRLTENGLELQRYVEHYLDGIDQLQERLSLHRQELSGLVRYAMPDSCLYTPHFPQLLQARNAQFPGVSLKVTICPSEEVVELLRRRDIDFGFVSKPLEHPSLELRHFATEEFLLVNARKIALADPKQAAKLPFVSYPGMEDLYAHWMSEAFPRHRIPGPHELNVVAEVNSLKGALLMAAGGAGSLFVQRHCAQELLREKKLHAHPLPAANKIYIASLRGETAPGRVRRVIQAFEEMKKA